jgi:hypothetical protein
MAIAWLGKPPLVEAQFTRGAITGVVKDSSGAVIPGADVAVAEERTGSSVSVRSLGDGVYLAPQLLPGTYRITVQMQGFKSVTLSGLTLNAGATLTQDVTLEVGATAESVEVSAQTNLVQTTNGQVGTTVQISHVLEMPLVDRDVHKLVNLVAGSFHNNDLRVSIAGGRLQSALFQLDGVGNSIAGLRNVIADIRPPIDSLQEFKVETNNYGAEYGRTTGGVLNAVTKNGTNEFHGSLYEFLRNDKFDARGWGVDRLPPLRRNNFGGTIGGPVRKNRTFFFFNQDTLMERSAATLTYNVGLSAWRQGNFSTAARDAGGRAEIVPIYDPESGTGTFLAPLGSSPFPGNVIPASRLDPVAVKALSFVPAANRAPDNPFNQAGNWQENVTSKTTTGYYTVRADHNWTDNTKMFVRYVRSQPESADSGYPASDFGAAAPNGNADRNRRQNVAVNLTHLLTPTKFVNVTGGYRRHTNARRTGGCCDTNYAQQLGLPGALAAGDATGGGFPRFNFGGGFVPVTPIGHLSAIDRFDVMTHTADFTGNITETRGRHTLKYGAQMTRYGASNFRSDSSGTWAFNGQHTRGITATGGSVANTGVNLADFLLGRLVSATVVVQPEVVKRLQYYGGYFQDDWRVNSRLTLNLGLRYDTETPVYAEDGRQSSFDLYAPNPRAGAGDIPAGATGITLFQGLNGSGKYLWRWNKGNFAPRFGFAWRVFGTSDTVVRGGFGLFFGDAYQSELLQALRLGFSNTYQVGAPVPFRLRDGVPRGALDDVPTSELTPTFGHRGTRFETSAVEFLDPTRKHPYSEMFNLSVQHQWKGVLLEVAGLGNMGRQVPFVSLNMNWMRPEMLSRTDIPERLRRPWTVLGGNQSQVTQLAPNWGLSNYLALTFKSERRYRNGVGWLVSYAFTRWIDNLNSPNSPLGDNDQIQNVYDIHNERSLSTNGAPHRLVLSPIADVPFGRGRRWLRSGILSHVIGGWQVAMVGTFQSGAPFGVTVLNGPLNILGDNAAGRVLRPNLVSGASLYADSKGQRAAGVRGRQWLNPASFAAPARFNFGNASRTLPKVLGPAMINWDSMLAKNFQVGERWRAQFRWEMFNMTNTPRWALPDQNLGTGTLGTITSASSRRIMQLALKLYW